jgi:hypothetical protein
VRAGELWWNGQYDAFDTKLDKIAPKGLLNACIGITQKAQVKLGVREGIGFKASVLREQEPAIYSLKLWKLNMEIEIAATESTDRAIAAVTKLKETVDGFRSVVRNDMVSMKAASERVQSEVSQMQSKYKMAVDLLTNQDFEKALANAERMAAALQQIQQLSKTKISFAVFEGSPE